ncbi:MAG: Gfo/Idh/MocA family oxidoreductase, partial [Actinomycetota bacterium]
VSVHSRNPSRAEAFGRQQGFRRWAATVEEAVAGDDIDAVYVSSHNELHRDHVVAAARAGKHILAEKPLALTMADARAMVAACEVADVVLATNHHLPASPVHLMMKELVASGEIGKVRSVHVNHAVGLPDRLHGWRVDDPVGGGVVLDVFVHDVAAIAAIIGGQAQTVLAAARRGVDAPAAPNSVMTVVGWTDDVLVQTHDAYDNYDLPTSIELLGDKGAIRASNAMTGDPVGELRVHHGSESTVIEIPNRRDLYLTAVEAFDAAIRGERTQPLVTAADGLRSLAAALAAQESLRTGATVAVERIV